MYAVIRTGGKQYTVRPGDVLRVEKLSKELGSEFDLTEVLMLGGDKTLIGEPTVANATVTVVVTQQAKSPKLIVFKKKRRQGYRRLAGHRQLFTELFIKSIKSPSGEMAEANSKPVVIDPADKIARIAKYAEVNKEKKMAARKADQAPAPKAAAKKKTAKKASVKAKKTTKKAGAKKAKKTSKK